ncbi:MAG: hypothetical protein ACI4UA_00315 [Bacteroidaceae bacterium]
MPLPQDFVSLMQSHYGCSQAERLCQALETTDPSVSVRLNMRKMSLCMSSEQVSSVLRHLDSHYEAVPWCPHAWYLPQRPSFTFDPLLHAGAYYVQEASSMYVADVLRRYLPLIHAASSCPLTALDLCAAPGGKSTLLASHLPQGSVLVSNEVIPKRALILAENMAKWTSGMPCGTYPLTALVTQNRPSDFAAFESQFDFLLTDVPCSGEGMFRKDEQAVRDWSLDNVELCRQRQRDILQEILPVLRPGGLLVYSTCTFNHHEDEENARYACQLSGGELLEERHFLPGRDRGEGFYVAVIRRLADADEASSVDIERLPARVHRYLRVLYDSSSSAADTASLPQIPLTYEQALQYLRREAIRVDAPRGMVTLCYQGFPLGQGKSVGSRINNLYPSEWRIRSGFTTPYSLFGDLAD